MIKITFPDGKYRDFNSGVTGLEIANSISTSLAKSALFIKFNDKCLDLSSTITTDGTVTIITAKDNEVLPLLRHTCAHVMAQAIKRLYPSAKFAIGPAIENGFYYDIDCETKITSEDFSKIEKEMAKIVSENLKIERKDMSTADAKKFFLQNGESYKVELIDDLEKNGVSEVSLYTQGEFTDLCRGPHLPSTSKIGVETFKLTSVAGAYWRGDVKNKMLQRIYATAWTTKAELEAYLKMQEEAEKRDHRKIGVAMDLFHFEPDYAPGAVFWHPKGWTLFQKLISYMRNKQANNGYIEVSTPTIMNRGL
ncbi:MAG: TGS domain-containing protein, partial [Alphaproteobacteria bacterium]|nr:TGS domain-containing protein [Alphaproteobacteria bacterium]